VISGELEIEKPDPRIFRFACDQLGVAPEQAIHMGDSVRSDVEGARRAGCLAWRFPHDVPSFTEAAARILAQR
ncbi:MAG: HAD-IA family hydrolase, partial [Myxococcota bacterium]